MDDRDLVATKQEMFECYIVGAGLRIAGTDSEMLERGILISLGTNSPPCNNHGMLDEMWLQASCIKQWKTILKQCPARSVVEMATINGAKTLGMDKELGSLTVGKKQTSLLWTLTSCATPMIYFQLVPGQQCYYTVMVEGEILVDAGELTSIKEEWLITEAERRAQEIVQRANIRF